MRSGYSGMFFLMFSLGKISQIKKKQTPRKETKMEKKKANRKPLIIVAVAVLLLLAVGGTYVINGLSHKPEVFRRIKSIRLSAT